MADDEDDAGGRPTPEELLAPAGPRRSNFTPAPTDADSLEAANNVFNDDAIAAALAAELARVASGPIPIQQGPAEPAAPAAPPAGAPPNPEPEASDLPDPVSSVPPATPEPEAAAAPAAPAATPQEPLGPPDWASPLFGQPVAPARTEPTPAEMLDDPFAPNAPSFAPATGSFPPPTAFPPPAADVPSEDSAQASDPDALRELYVGAPAPTVPAADAPPPPGYEAPAITPMDEQPSATLDAIEQLQAQLHLREQEAQEFASWESAMQAIGTPEALAEVARARAELAGADSAPTAPPAEEPVPDLAPPAAEPFATLAPPSDEPLGDFAPPAEEPLPDLAPPVAEPFATLSPPADEPIADFAPPAQEPLPDLPPPADDPFAAFLPPSDEFAGASSPAAPDAPPPPADDNPFAGFAPPTDSFADTFAAPSDPRDLSFDAPPPDAPPSDAPPSDAPPSDAPVFLEPASPEPPALVEPPPVEGVDALYLTAQPPSRFDSVPSPPAAPPVVTPPDAPAGFDDLLVGSGGPNPPAASTAFVAPDVPAGPDPAGDQPAGRRPFGDGVDRDNALDPRDDVFETGRDDAVDPSDSIFGSATGPVSVNTAGVAVVPQPVSLESQPIRVLAPAEAGVAPAVVLQRLKVSPAEPAGLEPTPIEQRVGRSARLFWLWFAANSSIVAIVFGTIIFGLGVSLRQAIVATLAGVAISFIPLGLGTLAGKRSGQPTMVISRATFGVTGNILPAIIALLSRLFWGASLLWILGEGTADILIGARLTDGFTGSQLTIVAIAVFFVIAVVVAFFGYALIAIAQLIISAISVTMIAGFIALTAQYINLGTALATGDGPWILVVTGAVLVFSFVGLAWANSGADVARYQRPGSSGGAAMLWATFGAGLPAFVLIGYGALLAASNLTLAENIAANPLDSLGRLLPVWYPVPLLAATALSLLSGVVLAMYSGAFALQAAGLRLRRSLATLLVAVLVVVIAIFISISVTNLDQLVRDFSTTVAVPIAAWAGIFGAEVMIRKRALDSASLLSRGGIYPNVRWGNLIALVGVSVIGYAFLSATTPGLGWEGYGFTALGIPLTSVIATSDFGVLLALLLGLLVGAGAGTSGIRSQEKLGLPPQ